MCITRPHHNCSHLGDPLRRRGDSQSTLSITITKKHAYSGYNSQEPAITIILWLWFKVKNDTLSLDQKECVILSRSFSYQTMFVVVSFFYQFFPIFHFSFIDHSLPLNINHLHSSPMTFLSPVSLTSPYWFTSSIPCMVIFRIHPMLFHTPDTYIIPTFYLECLSYSVLWFQSW